MKINFNTILRDLDGDPIPKQVDVKQCPNCGFLKGEVTPFGERSLKSVALDSLNAIFQDEQNLPGEERAKRGLLQLRIYRNPEKIDLSVEEVALIKRLIGKMYAPIIVYQSNQLLEGKDPTNLPEESNEN